jgi:hypothetical protein
MGCSHDAARKRATMRASLRVLAAVLIHVCPTVALAQAATAASPDPIFAVPVTKVLAIGSFTAQAPASKWKPIVPAEMRQTALLYLNGKIDQWYVRPDQSGVVFVMNVTDPAEAKALLDPLPLGRAGLMTFELIPLGPLSPLRTLLGPTGR